MVSCRPKFPLWYFDRPEHDLRQMFPDEPAVDFVHELLKKCVVESENEIKLRDAGELLGEIDTAIASVSCGRQLPGRNAKMRCRFCGLGIYKEAERWDIVGNGGSPTQRQTYYLCDYCGHLESFILGRNNPPACVGGEQLAYRALSTCTGHRNLVLSDACRRPRAFNCSRTTGRP